MAQITDQAPYSKHLIFFVTYEWGQLARVLRNTRLERLAMDRHSSLLSPFISYKENKVYQYVNNNQLECFSLGGLPA
jgi:hypothetical protein